MNRASRYFLSWKANEEAIRRVRELHRPWKDSPTLCLQCDKRLPCPTLRALDGEK